MGKTTEIAAHYIGLTGVSLAAIALLIIGIGVITVMKPAVGVVVIIGMYAVLSVFIKDPWKVWPTTVALFVFVGLFWATEVQQLFEAIPILGIIFQ